MKQSFIRLGIISAMHQEQHGLIEAMEQRSILERGMRKYVSGTLWGVETVCVLSRIGKVAAATTTTMLIEHFGVTHILFTGVAGSASEEVNVGDIVVADTLVQYDMDASPLFPRFEIPLLGISHFKTDPKLNSLLLKASHQFIDHDFAINIKTEESLLFDITQPNIHQGLIGSGDEFINCANKINALKNHLPTIQAVEMEGAAVAQTCFEFGIPYALLRTISDNANHDSPTDFMRFIDTIAANYTFGIMKNLCGELANQVVLI